MQACYALGAIFCKHLRIKDSDGGGFEPPVPFGTHAFQACTINHSVTHPEQSSSSSESYSRLVQAYTPRLRGRGRLSELQAPEQFVER
jgi:hypothetical protein